MVRVLSGKVEAISAMCRDPLKIPSNGEFRHFFSSWLMQQAYPRMQVKTVVGSHLYEVRDDSCTGAYSVLLTNVRDNDAKFNITERYECLGALHTKFVKFLETYDCRASEQLRMSLTLVQFESCLCEWMKFREEQAAM